MAKMRYVSIPTGLLLASCDATGNIYPLHRFLSSNLTNYFSNLITQIAQHPGIQLQRNPSLLSFALWFILHRNCLHPSKEIITRSILENVRYDNIQRTDQAVIAAVVLSSSSTWHPIHIPTLTFCSPRPKSRTHARRYQLQQKCSSISYNFHLTRKLFLLTLGSDPAI